MNIIINDYDSNEEQEQDAADKYENFYKDFYEKYPIAILYNDEPCFLLSDICEAFHLDNEDEIYNILKDAKTRIPCVLRFTYGDDGTLSFPGETTYVTLTGLYLISTAADKNYTYSYLFNVFDIVLPALRRDEKFYSLKNTVECAELIFLRIECAELMTGKRRVGGADTTR